MKYSDIKSALVTCLAFNPTATYHLQSSPGTGKTSCLLDVVKTLGITNVTTFKPANHDPVDLTGIPSVVDGVTVWNAAELIHKHQLGTGRSAIIFDEIAQAGAQMQNVLAGIILDRELDGIKLDPECIILTTGNRSEDKAGANKLLTHLGNRICILDMEVSLDDVSSYMLDAGIDPMGIAFLRLRPELLNKFDPNSPTNATPRSWEKLFKSVPLELPVAQYFALAKGYVGEGAASEWAAAKEIMATMPNPDYCILQPDTAEVPETPAAQYAITTALSLKTDAGNFDRCWTYIRRLPRERHITYILDVVRRDPSLKRSETFVRFSVESQSIFIPD